MASRYVLICTALAVLAGCSHRGAPAEEAAPAPAPAPDPNQGWTLTINNRHWLDVSIYISSEGQRSHVAVIPATHSQSFDMPARMITVGRLITLEADPIGAPRGVRSERLSVQPGQHVEWTLENGLTRSSVSIW
jgi:hypothetical protein